MKSNWITWLFVAAIVVVPLSVFGIVKWYERNYVRLPILGREQQAVTDFHFTDQDGNNFEKENWKGKIVVANFFFTHCPGICPKMINQLKRIDRDRDSNILITSFTVDPERDDAASLKHYAQQFNLTKNWSLVTGDKKELYRFARKGLEIIATDGDGGPNDFIHSENLVLIDPLQRMRGYYKGTSQAEVNRLKQDIKKLEKEFRIKTD
jgi:protein SCO1/2